MTYLRSNGARSQRPSLNWHRRTRSLKKRLTILSKGEKMSRYKVEVSEILPTTDADRYGRDIKIYYQEVEELNLWEIIQAVNAMKEPLIVDVGSSVKIPGGIK